MTQSQEVQISAQVTPNPDTLKFLVNIDVIKKGTVNITSKSQAEGSPLAQEIFDIAGVLSIMVGQNFISVTKTNQFDWTVLVEPITSVIKNVLSDPTIEYVNETLATEHAQNKEETPTEKKIKEILDTEIRPAVAMDGGDITFHSFEDGILRLQLQGACSSCPSATMTLKMGIENRLKEDIPELVEVIQV